LPEYRRVKPACTITNLLITCTGIGEISSTANYNFKFKFAIKPDDTKSPKNLKFRVTYDFYDETYGYNSVGYIQKSLTI
jgi:hypothetical protein